MQKYFPAIICGAAAFWWAASAWLFQDGWLFQDDWLLPDAGGRFRNQLAVAALMAVQGLGLWLVRRDPVRHWPVVAMALAQLVAVVVVLLARGLTAEAMAAVGALAFWSGPLVAMLAAAGEQDRRVESVIRLSTVGSLRQGFNGHRTQQGEGLNALVGGAPALLVFLRHSGCTFCRQTLADLGRVWADLRSRGVAVVVVHHSSEESMAPLLERYGLADVPVVHDPQRRLYRHFGLEAGSWWQVAGPLVLLKSVYSVFWQWHGMWRPDGHARQLPGVFAVSGHAVREAFYHRRSSDRPDLAWLAERVCADRQP